MFLITKVVITLLRGKFNDYIGFVLHKDQAFFFFFNLGGDGLEGREILIIAHLPRNLEPDLF